MDTDKLINELKASKERLLEIRLWLHNKKCLDESCKKRKAKMLRDIREAIQSINERLK